MTPAQPDAGRNLRGVTERRNGGKAAGESRGRNEKSSWYAVEARGTDSATARPFITHAGCRDASQLPGVRPTVRLASRSLFHSTGSGSSRLVALYLYAPATATLPMEVDARLPRSGPGILLHYGGGRACDERRQIAAGTCWINLLSISAVTSPRRSRSRIVATTIRRRHHSPSSAAARTTPRLLIRIVASNCRTGVVGEIETRARQLMDYRRSPALPLSNRSLSDKLINEYSSRRHNIYRLLAICW